MSDENSGLGFDSIANTVEEYFYLHQLNLNETIPDETYRKEILKFVLDKIDEGKTAIQGFTELLAITQDKQFVKQQIKKLKNIPKV